MPKVMIMSGFSSITFYLYRKTGIAGMLILYGFVKWSQNIMQKFAGSEKLGFHGT